MKTKILNFAVLVLGIALLNACSEDENESWKGLPNTPISGEQAVLTVNGQSSTSGSVTLTAKSATQGTLLFENVLPGYSNIEMEVTMAECPDGSFDITGERGLASLPSMITRETAAPVIFQISAKGNITPDGTAVINLTSVLTKEAQGGLAGTYNLLTNLKTDNPEIACNSTAPLYIVWSAQNPEKANAETMAPRLTSFVSSFIYQLLHSVTLSEDGNITAEYWSADGGLDDDSMINYMMNGIQNNHDGTGTMINLHPDDPWATSPKNLAYWYVSGGYLYVIPSITAIIDQTGNDSGSETSGSLADLTGLLDSLKGYGIKTDELLPILIKWMGTGIPLKYEKTDSGLKLYADKEMCTPVVEALLPALPKLDEMIKELASNSDNFMMQMLPEMLPLLLAIENLASLDPIWKENTKNFEVQLNFEK